MLFEIYSSNCIEYDVVDEGVVRSYLESEFGMVCKEHGGELGGGRVWAYFTFSLGGLIQPCFSMARSILRGSCQPINDPEWCWE